MLDGLITQIINIIMFKKLNKYSNKTYFDSFYILLQKICRINLFFFKYLNKWKLCEMSHFIKYSHQRK